MFIAAHYSSNSNPVTCIHSSFWTLYLFLLPKQGGLVRREEEKCILFFLIARNEMQIISRRLRILSDTIFLDDCYCYIPSPFPLPPTPSTYHFLLLSRSLSLSLSVSLSVCFFNQAFRNGQVVTQGKLLNEIQLV